MDEGEEENWVDELTKYSNELKIILNDLKIVKPGYLFDVKYEDIYLKPRRDQSPGGSRGSRRSRSRSPSPISIPSQVIIKFILSSGKMRRSISAALYENKRSSGTTDVGKGVHSNIGYNTGYFLFHLQLLIILLHVPSFSLDNMTDSPERATRGIYSLLKWEGKSAGPEMELRETTKIEDVFKNISKKIKNDSDADSPWVEDVEDKIKEFISILKNKKEKGKYDIQHAIKIRRSLGKKKKKKKKKTKKKSKTRGQRR